MHLLFPELTLRIKCILLYPEINQLICRLQRHKIVIFLYFARIVMVFNNHI